MQRIETTLENLLEIAKSKGISPKKLDEASPNYSLPDGIVTFSDVEVVVYEDTPKMNHIAIKAVDKKGLNYTISIGRLQFSGIPATETKETVAEKIKHSNSGVYYLPGTRLNNWLQNDQVQACKQLIGQSFKVENIDMFTLKFAEEGYTTAPTVADLVVKQVPKLTPVKA